MGKPDDSRSFVGVDSATRRLVVAHRFRVRPYDSGGMRLVSVHVERDALPQYGSTICLRTPSAIAAGHAMIEAATSGGRAEPPWLTLRRAEEAYLSTTGWRTVDGDDWAPSEDRGNLWDFDRALAEQRRRDARGGEHG